MIPELMRLFDFLLIQRRNEVLVLVQDARLVRKQDELLRLECSGNSPCHKVCINIICFSMNPDTDRRNDRDEAALLQREKRAWPDFRHLADKPDIDVLGFPGTLGLFCHFQLLRLDQSAVLARESNGLAACLVDEVHDFLVHLAAQDHFNDVHGLFVGDPLA